MSLSPVTFNPPLAVPRSPRYHSLDFWRGAACLMVIMIHSTYYVTTDSRPVWSLIFQVISFFWVSVPAFFVISGYGIAAAVDSTRRRPFAIRTYFYRRFRRVYPPFWIFVGLVIVAVAGAEIWVRPHLFTDPVHPIRHPAALSAAQWIGNLSLTETWRANVAGPPKQLFVGTVWTLCYEEQFYAVMGLLLFLFRRHFFRAAIGVTVLSVAARHGAAALGLPVGGFFFDGQWPMFAAGILVYHQINYGERRRDPLVYAVLGAGLLYCVRSPAVISPFSTDMSAFAAFSFAALLLLLHRFDARIAASRLLRPVTLCGTMSYSLYLIHWPVVKAISHTFALMGLHGPGVSLLVVMPLSMLSAIVAAWGFHLAVERRFMPRTVPARGQVRAPEQGLVPA